MSVKMPGSLDLEDLFSDEKQLEEEKIYLMFVTKMGPAKCDMTGKKFDVWYPLGFFVDRDLKRPVCPSVALEHGFTMDRDDFVKLMDQVDIYRSFTQGEYFKIEKKSKILNQDMMDLHNREKSKPTRQGA